MAAIDRLNGLASEVTLAIKAPCLVATTGPITLAGVQSIDGVTVGNNSERVLVKDQTDQTQNNIYIASSGNWTFAQDAGGNTDWALGSLVYVQHGNTNAGTIFSQNGTSVPLIIGSSALIFAAQSIGLNPLIVPLTTNFFTNQGARIQRLNDRVFFGGATVNDGQASSTGLDWLSQAMAAQGVASAGMYQTFAQNYFLTNLSPSAGNAIVAGAQTAKFGGASDGIGVVSVGLANNTTATPSAGGPSAWAFLGQAFFYNTAHNTQAVGAELDVISFDAGSGIAFDPYSITSSILPVTSGLQILSIGSGFYTGTTHNNTVGILIGNANNTGFMTGISFMSGGVVGGGGPSGTTPAIAMANGMDLVWYSAHSTLGAYIGTDGSSNFTFLTVGAANFFSSGVTNQGAAAGFAAYNRTGTSANFSTFYRNADVTHFFDSVLGGDAASFTAAGAWTFHGSLTSSGVGSASAPNFVFGTAGSNYGWYAPAAGQVALSVAGGRVIDYGITLAGYLSFTGSVIMSTGVFILGAANSLNWDNSGNTASFLSNFGAGGWTLNYNSSLNALVVDTSGNGTFAAAVTATGYKVGSNQVVGARQTGWTVATGTPSRATFATGSVTLATLAGVVMALEQDLITHGLIGA